MENVVILWDIENVTPTSSNTLFIEGMWEYAESIGRIVSSHAYADWSKPQFRKIGPVLSSLHFHMVHIPREKTTKNSADMQLVSDAMDLLRYYDHINTYLLISGDSDFRPLLHTLRKAGKKVHIICDITTAAQDLLYISDFFVDYRDILHYSEHEHEELGSMFTFEEEENFLGKSYDGINSREFWYPCLAEAAELLEMEHKTSNMSTAKIKLKMLNPEFDEKRLGYKRWSYFVHGAAKAGYVDTAEKDTQTIISPIKGKFRDGQIQKAMIRLCEIILELDKGKEPEFHSFAVVSSHLADRDIDLDYLGFKKFKKFILAAEVRGLVETKIENKAQYIKLIKESIWNGGHLIS